MACNIIYNAVSVLRGYVNQEERHEGTMHDKSESCRERMIETRITYRSTGLLSFPFLLPINLLILSSISHADTRKLTVSVSLDDSLPCALLPPGHTLRSGQDAS